MGRPAVPRETARVGVSPASGRKPGRPGDTAQGRSLGRSPASSLDLQVKKFKVERSLNIKGSKWIDQVTWKIQNVKVTTTSLFVV